MFNAKDNLELLEERQRELLELLGRMEIDDSKRSKVQEELNLISKIIVETRAQEETRLNNNARISIDEERLRIDQEKLENDKQWKWVTVGTSVGGAVLGAGMQWMSYHMEETGYAYKSLKAFGERTVEFFSNLRFWRR